MDGRGRGGAPTFLVGMDGSEQSLAAARVTSMLAAARGARLVLGAIVPQEGPAAEFPGTGDGALPDGDRLAYRSRSRGRGLDELAARERASLLAVGAAHRYGVGRVRPGGLSEQLLCGSARPVLVVSPDAVPEHVRSVGVAHAGDPDGDAALVAGADLAADLGADLEVLTVVEAGRDGRSSCAELREALRVEREQRLADTAARLAHRVSARTRAVLGHPGQALVRAAEEVDLLVLGSRGYGPPGAVMLGSVARRVVSHARAPVLVVPRAVPAVHAAVA